MIEIKNKQIKILRSIVVLNGIKILIAIFDSQGMELEYFEKRKNDNDQLLQYLKDFNKDENIDTLNLSKHQYENLTGMLLEHKCYLANNIKLCRCNHDRKQTISYLKNEIKDCDIILHNIKNNISKI